MLTPEAKTLLVQARLKGLSVTLYSGAALSGDGMESEAAPGIFVWPQPDCCWLTLPEDPDKYRAGGRSSGYAIRVPAYVEGFPNAT